MINDVVVKLPQQNLFRGDSFSVDVKGSTTLAIGAYSVDCSVDITQLTITDVTANAAWTMTKNLQGGLLKITAIPADAALIMNGNLASETLFTINLKVTAGATVNSQTLISCSIITLADKNGATPNSELIEIN